MRLPPGSRPAALALAAAVVLAGCTAADGPSSGTRPAEPAIPTVTAGPPPAPSPPAGRLLADLRQSSRDAALGRVQVWIVNDTRRDLRPRTISYRDPRLRRPVPGDRIRPVPAGSFRGYSLPLPPPVCGGRRAGSGRVVLTTGRRTLTLPAADDNDLIRRYVAGRCLEAAVARVARLSWDTRVAVRGSGADSTASLVLLVEPTGRSHGRLTIDTVHGTPVISTVDAPYWSPGVTVTGRGRPRRIALRARPARCDPHVFMEAAGATAFRVRLRLDGRPGELILRMPPEVAGATLRFATSACGLS